VHWHGDRLFIETMSQPGLLFATVRGAVESAVEVHAFGNLLAALGRLSGHERLLLDLTELTVVAKGDAWREAVRFLRLRPPFVIAVISKEPEPLITEAVGLMTMTLDRPVRLFTSFASALEWLEEPRALLPLAPLTVETSRVTVSAKSPA
jgi:hypothetical protein